MNKLRPYECHDGDIISRQAAIDALRDAENHAFSSYYQGLKKAHKIIADLPSAQPEPHDLVSRQAAIDAQNEA